MIWIADSDAEGVFEEGTDVLPTPEMTTSTLSIYFCIVYTSVLAPS